jgi:hypothetical protein
MGTTHLSGLNIKFSALTEGAAGNFTVTGITTDDSILGVVGWGVVLGEAAPNTIAITKFDLTSEFTITATDTINNGGGTTLADKLMLCIWWDKDAS